VYDTVHLGKKLFLFGLLLEFLEAVVSKWALAHGTSTLAMTMIYYP
jgi:hypothetical protein